LDLVRAEVLKRRDPIRAREFRLDSKLVEDEVRRQRAAAARLADVDLTPVEVINRRDVTAGQDMQTLAWNPEKVAKVLMNTRSHLARQGLDGIGWDERDINAGIMEEREKVFLWSLAPPEAEPVAFEGCGKVEDEAVISAFISTREDREWRLFACLHRSLVGCSLRDRRSVLGSSDRGPPDGRHGVRNLVGAPLQAQTKNCRHEQPYGTKHDSAPGGPQPCRRFRSHVDQRARCRLRHWTTWKAIFPVMVNGLKTKPLTLSNPAKVSSGSIWVIQRDRNKVRFLADS
jgi:hypothetical protein